MSTGLQFYVRATEVHALEAYIEYDPRSCCARFIGADGTVHRTDEIGSWSVARMVDRGKWLKVLERPGPVK